MADGYSFNPATGVVTSPGGWGGTQSTNYSTQIDSYANQLAKDAGIPIEEARNIVNSYVQTRVAGGGAGAVNPLGGFNDGIPGQGDPNALIKSGTATYDRLLAQAKARAGDLTTQANAAAEAAATTRRNDINAQLDAFIQSMLPGAAPNDPVYQQLIKAGTNAAQASAGRGGLSGRSSLAGTQAASTAQANIAPYMAARASLGLQAQNLRNNREISLGQLDQDWAKFQTTRNDQLASASAGGLQQQNSMIGSILGGAIGGLGFLGGPQLGAATMGMGASLGGSVGGGFSPPPQFGPSASRYGGGGGGRGGSFGGTGF